MTHILEMVRRKDGSKETSEHPTETAAFLEMSRKLTQGSGAGFMMYSSASCKKSDDKFYFWKMEIS